MLNVGIVGCGNIADQHAEAIGAYKEARIVAACDQEILMADQFCERYGITKAFDSTEKMIDVAKPDVIHITTPPSSHKEIALKAIDAGCHLYVEKPFAIDLKETEVILEAAQNMGIKVTVGNNAQFTLAAKEMRNVIASNFCGDIIHLESIYCYNFGDARYAKAFLNDTEHWVRRLPGQLLQNIISHGICKLMEFLEPQGIQINAYGFQSKFMKSLGDSTVLDELRVALIDRVGKSGYFTFSSQMKPILHQLRIFGSLNSLIVDDDQQTVIKLAGNRRKSYLEQLVTPLSLSKKYAGQSIKNVRNLISGELHGNMGMMELIKSFYDAIINESDPPIKYKEIKSTVLIMEEIFEQIYGRDNT